MKILTSVGVGASTTRMNNRPPKPIGLSMTMVLYETLVGTVRPYLLRKWPVHKNNRQPNPIGLSMTMALYEIPVGVDVLGDPREQPPTETCRSVDGKGMIASPEPRPMGEMAAKPTDEVFLTANQPQSVCQKVTKNGKRVVEAPTPTKEGRYR